jgi:hypothetical protein
MRGIAPFRDSFHDDAGVDEAGDKASGEKDENEVTKGSTETQLPQ